MTTTHEYALERSQREYERLALQGEILKPMTRRLFEEAGIGHLVKYLRSGGTAAFLEPWFLPPGGPDTMMQKAGMLIYETLLRSGAHTDLGPRLHRVFSNAGLPPPRMRLESVVDSRSDSPLNGYLARTVAHFLPKAVEYGLVKLGEIDPDLLAKGVRAEMSAAGFATFGPLLILAWSRKE